MSSEGTARGVDELAVSASTVDAPESACRMLDEASSDDLAGRLVDGRYRLGCEIGMGGMSVVHEARHVRLGRTAAIKTLRPDYAHDGSARRRLEREARTLAQLQHPHVVRGLDLGTTEEGVPFLVMELLVGETLLESMRRTDRLPVDQAVRVARQLLSALEAVHAAHVVHRDVKPANIFLARRAPAGRWDAKLLDFGIARATTVDPEEARLTRPGTIAGTPYFLPPERLCGMWEVDPRADLWAAAVVLYESLTGHVPFPASSYAELVRRVTEAGPELAPLEADHIPPGLRRFLLTALAGRALDRFPDAHTMREALEASFRDRIPSVRPGRVRRAEVDDDDPTEVSDTQALIDAGLRCEEPDAH